MLYLEYLDILKRLNAPWPYRQIDQTLVPPVRGSARGSASHHYLLNVPVRPRQIQTLQYYYSNTDSPSLSSATSATSSSLRVEVSDVAELKLGASVRQVLVGPNWAVLGARTWTVTTRYVVMLVPHCGWTLPVGGSDIRGICHEQPPVSRVGFKVRPPESVCWLKREPSWAT